MRPNSETSKQATAEQAPGLFKGISECSSWGELQGLGGCQWHTCTVLGAVFCSRVFVQAFCYYSVSPVRIRYQREYKYGDSIPHPASHGRDFVPFHGVWIKLMRPLGAHLEWSWIIFFLLQVLCFGRLTAAVFQRPWETEWQEVLDRVIFLWWIRARHSFVPLRNLWSGFISSLSLMGNKLRPCQVVMSGVMPLSSHLLQKALWSYGFLRLLTTPLTSHNGGKAGEK